MKRVLLTALLLVAVAGCNSPEGPMPPQAGNPDQPGETTPAESVGPIWSCSSEHADALTRLCLVDHEPADKIGKLVQALWKWGESGDEWTSALLNTRSFDRRFNLTSDEKQCLQNSLCKEKYQ